MPRLVDDLTHDQQMWLVNHYGPQGGNSGCHESILAVMGPETANNSNFLDVMEDGALNGRHFPVHARYPHSSEATVPMQGNQFTLHQKVDNRNTIFRGRGPMYSATSKAEYEYHHREYHNYPHFQSQQSPQPLFQTLSNFHGDQNFDPKASKSPRKRDRFMENGMRSTELPSTAHADPSCYASMYLHNTPPGSMMPFPGLDDDPHTYSSGPNKHHYPTVEIAQWNESNTDGNVSEGTENKCNPSYPHLGEKLTWQQSYDNLKVYKKTYGVSFRFC